MDSWMRIETWLKEHLPGGHKVLKPPAADEAIHSAQATLPGPFPPELLDYYRRHDGQSGVMDPIAGEWQLLPLKGVLSNWKVQKDLLDKGAFQGSEAKAIGPVRAAWWNEKWIPFASDGAGDLQCVDLDPAEGGKVGQIVIYWHDREERERVADSLNEWLDRLADDLEAGKYPPGGEPA
jgi:cell wall assembly regulator SMI1